MLIALVFLFNSSHLQAADKAKPVAFVTPNKSSVLSHNDYEDIRLDSNGDGFIDVWSLKNKNTKIIMHFEMQHLRKFQIIKNNGKSISEASFTYSNGVYQKSFFTSRSPYSMNGIEVDANVCNNSNTPKELKKLNETIKSLDSLEAAEKAASCSDKGVQEPFQDAIADVISNEKFAKCISEPKTLKAFSKDDKTTLEMLSLQFELDAKKILAQQSGEGLFQCKIVDGTGRLQGNYVENKYVTISIPTNYDKSKLFKNVTPLLYHELLHRSGLVDEEANKKIVDICALNKDLPPTDKKIGGGFSQKSDAEAAMKKNAKTESFNTKDKAEIVQQRSIASTAAEKGGGGADVNIAKEVSIAEVQQAVPSSDKLAVNSINMTDEGKAQAVAASERQSAPVFAMADRAMGVMNTSALASNDDSSSSSNSSSSSSSSGERYQARYGRYESKTVSSTNNDYDAEKGIYIPNSRNGTTATGEVNLAQNSAAAATRTTNAETSAKARMMASAGKAVPANQDGMGGETAVGSPSGLSDSSGAAASRTNAGGSGTFYANGGNSNTRKTNAQTRSTASVPSAPLPEQYGTRDRVIDQFSGSSYSQVKDLIRKDSDFKRALEAYEIKVVDTNGGVYGSAQGKTIYSDDGQQFLMIKRK